MIQFILNDTPTAYAGAGSVSLLSFLRNDRHLTAAKEGCSAQAACGACLVEVDGKAVLSCVTPMSTMEGKRVTTLEGLPESLRRTLGEAFAKAGAVQCGFCTPGFLTRTRLLLRTNPHPTRAEVIKAVRPHLCRCTGYVKLVDAVLLAAAELAAELAAERAREHPAPAQTLNQHQGLGGSPDRFKGYERAVGQRPFVDDLFFDNMLHGALHFSQHARARIMSIDTRAAEAMPGVRRVLTARDIPGQQCTGLHMDDWPLYVAEGQITRCVGDVLACVLADTVEQARAAAAAVRVEYEELPGIFDMDEALTSPIHITPEGNILKHVAYRQGDDVEAVLASSAHVAEGYFETPPVEHAFLEVECSVALPRVFTTRGAEGKGIHLYSMSQGIWHDRHSVCKLLALPEALVQVTLVDAGGGFGGKEDLTTQGHAALGALLTQRPVKVKLSRPESLRMHPKRHATRLRYRMGCDAHGKLTALYARILGDSGAYASAGGPVMGRAAVHAAGAYHFPHQDVESLAVYTNNPPAGAFRGFGVNQVTFAVETLLDDLCHKGGFDRWQFRHDNALDTGGLMPTGQRLKEGMSLLRQCLEAVKPQYDAARKAGLFAGLACGIKNTGFGNGIPEECRCIISVDRDEGEPRIVIDHGWTEMGQGVHTVARQIFCEVTGFTDISRIHVRSRTESGAFADATTASRGSFQLGHAVLRAAEAFKKALDTARGSLDLLVGHSFSGDFVSVTARAPQAGQPVAGPVFSHEAYSFAAHLALCDAQGRIVRVVAAHDSGRPINRQLFEGQVEGGVVMGLGYALSEQLVYAQGQLNTEKLHALGLLRSIDVPDIEVIIVEGRDPRGPCGIKGLGEITCIPTAPAVASALRARDGLRRTVLPVERG